MNVVIEKLMFHQSLELYMEVIVSLNVMESLVVIKVALWPTDMVAGYPRTSVEELVAFKPVAQLLNLQIKD